MLTNNMEAERWRTIEGYEYIYDISDHGRVRRSRIAKKIGKAIPGMILSPSSNGHYWIVHLFKNSRGKVFKISRLVAEAFIPNPAAKPEVNHKDGNCYNDHYSNLEWVTRLENAQHAVKMGHYHYGSNNGRAKLSAADVQDIRALDETCTCTRQELAEMYEITTMQVGRIVNGKSWEHV